MLRAEANLVMSVEREAVSKFGTQVKSVGGHFEHIPDIKDASAYITKIALARNAKRIVLTDDFLSFEAYTELAKNGTVEATIYGRSSREDFYKAVRIAEIGVSSVDLAVAETGTLIISTTDESNRLVTALPEIHVAIVPSSKLVSTMKEAAEHISNALRKGREALTVSLISASSRTSDIADIVILGVHGPKELHVLLLDQERLGGI